MVHHQMVIPFSLILFLNDSLPFSLCFFIESKLMEI